MLVILSRSWALLLGVMLLMVGNGMQGTLLGIRGDLEDFTTFEMSLIMSAYFVGFLGGSQFAPELIRRVGHVRVFAALASFISAILILFPTAVNPWVWILLRLAIGFCFSAVYVTAESWLNNASANEHRGKALSLYMIVQLLGMVSAQGMMLVGDPSGYILFIIPSVLVSISFAPILLSVVPTPAFDRAKPMGLVQLFHISPLSCVGMVLIGGVFSAQFGMASVYATQAGFSVEQISIFIATIYVGGILTQFPIGFISDRMDRRKLIIALAVIGTIGATLGTLTQSYPILLVSAFAVGGIASPIYSLLIAYTNDYLEADDMAAASGRLVFLNGLGAIGGPILTGWMMTEIGPSGFYVFLAGLLLLFVAYGMYRSTQRQAPSSEDRGSYAPVLPTATPVAVEAAQEFYIETSEDEADVTPVKTVES